MVTNDATILKVKHEVLERVAKLAFDGEFDEKKDQIAYEMIPGPKAQFRCCIYKEREVIRERVNLAEGKTPLGEKVEKKGHRIVYVIPAACAECPISRYTVTNNCQNCMGKACYNSCNFGAITIGMHQAYIDPSKCRECGKCAAACPYNAIADLMRPCRKSCPVDALKVDQETGIAVIDEEKCISCGQCIHSCPFGAIGSITFIVDVVNAIRDENKRVVAMLAPALEGQYGADVNLASMCDMLKKVGFDDTVEVGLGGDLTALYEAREWAEAYKEGKKMTTSCCPAFVNMVKRHYPKVMDHVSTTVSPMCAVSRMEKAKDPNTVTVFIGPCIAKKSEAMDGIEGNADYVLTTGELFALMNAKGVEIEPTEEKCQQASVFGKRFGNSGGVTNAVLQSLKEENQNTDITVTVCNGADECKKALLMLQAGRLKSDFIEGMVCVGGCVGGPSKHKTEMEAKRARDKLIKEADGRMILENLSNVDLDSFSMHRS
ncbi:MAG: 4Fe-4S dicluster domain-containing protein [Clostridiales bacterium]|nr:4Fe-4S dicluster domain-containing protein [Clostridiales bacterium]